MNKLIAPDGSEPNYVRRRLLRTDPALIKPLLESLQQRGGPLEGVRIDKPEYTTNAWPLYVYCCGTDDWPPAKLVYDQVTLLLRNEKAAQSVDEDRLNMLVQGLANTEIDILVEDTDYFVFIEAKKMRPGDKPRFGRKSDVHQLVWQHAQGKLLERAMKKDGGHKRFALATIGAYSDGKEHEVPLTQAARELLQLVGDDRTTLSVVGIPWPQM